MGEGVRSALAGRRLSAVLLLLVCWIGAAPGAADALAVARVVDHERVFLAAGGNIVVAVNKEAGISALACDRLARLPGIQASAAIGRLAQPAVISAAPGADLAVFAVTAGIWKLLGAVSAQTREAIVPLALSSRLGLADGDWVHLLPAPGTVGAELPREPVRVTTADAEILGQEYTGILLPMTATEETSVDACLVAATPTSIAAVKNALPSFLPGQSGQTVVLDRLVSGRFTADYSMEYRTRPLIWAWLASGSLLGLVWLLLQWTRRSADALFATMGADATARLVLRGTEWLVIAALGGLWAVALGVAAAAAFGAPVEVAFTYAGRHVLCTLLWATVIVLVSQQRRPRSLLAELKDR